MMGLPAKWLLGGALLLTLWLVWQAPPAPENNSQVVAAVQAVAQSRPTATQADSSETQNFSQTLLNRQSPSMVSDLFRTPPSPIATEPAIKIPEPTAAPALPFRYIGRIEKGASVTVFILEGEALHLLQAGDSPRADYKLEAIDLTAGELRWRYLPAQTIRNMSIKP